MQHKPHSPLSRKKTLERLKGRHEIRMRCRHGLPFGLRSVRLVSMGVPTESVLMWPSCEKTHMTAIISVRSFIKQTNKNSCDKITIFFHDAWNMLAMKMCNKFQLSNAVQTSCSISKGPKRSVCLFCISRCEIKALYTAHACCAVFKFVFL